MTEQEIRTALRAYVDENFLYMRPGFPFGDDDLLMTRGIIDSLGVMELIGFVEERFGVKPAENEVTEANFATLARIARFVASRLDIVESERP
jgi:acyl carrier protein